MKKLCLIIKELREKKMISQEKMANQLYITQSTYSRIETGKTQISLDQFIRISTILEIAPTKLLEYYITPDMVDVDSSTEDPIEERLKRIDFKQSKAIERLEAQNENLRQLFMSRFNP